MNLSPIGLMFAAEVAVFLAIGQVANKKVVEGQNVAASVFWIRAFALPVFAVVLLALAFRGSPPLIHAPAALKPEDLTDIPGLAEQLRNPANPAVRRIAGSLSNTTLTLLSNYSNGAFGAKLAENLRKDFDSNRILGGELLYNSKDFAGVKLSPETLHVLGKNPRGEVRLYANRLLLEDLFPGSIAQKPNCNLFGLQSLSVRPQMAFGVYLLIEVILVVWSQYLNSLALKVSPISLCVPFTAFAPVTVLIAGYLVLSEMPTLIGLMGIGLILIGGVLMHRKLFAVSWKAPIEAMVKEKGSRYMLLSVLIAAVFTPIEKQLILMSDALTAVFYYGAGTLVAFWILCLVLRAPIKQVLKQKPGWAMVCGLLDASMMLAQFVAVMFLPVVITNCIKRAGIVLTVLAGWLFFREREIADRLIGSLAMVGGIALFYLPLRLPEALVMTGLVVVGLALALYLTRPGARKLAALAEEPAQI
jgi:uncharacterized membrane protein